MPDLSLDRPLDRSLGGPRATPVPVVFIHYGDSAYLHYTLSAAVLQNPDTPVVLLGDAGNRQHTALGVHWVPMADHCGPAYRRLAAAYRPIAGARRGFDKPGGVPHWARFNFLKWALILDWMEAAGAARIWTFDSDVLLLRDLAPLEAWYAGCDGTEMCVGQCLNGLVPYRTVAGYVAHMTARFETPGALAGPQARAAADPRYGYTEMEAYVDFRMAAGLRTRNLSQPHHNGVFDHQLLRSPGPLHGPFEMVRRADGLVHNRPYLGADGAVYYRRLSDDARIRVHGINMGGCVQQTYHELRAHSLRNIAARRRRRAAATR